MISITKDSLIFKIWYYFEKKRFSKEKAKLEKELRNCKNEENKIIIISDMHLLNNMTVSDYKIVKKLFNKRRG